MNLLTAARRQQLAEHSGNQLLTALTGCLLFQLFVVAPLQAMGVPGAHATGLLIGIAMIGLATAISAGRITFYLLVLAFILILATTVSLAFRTGALTDYLLATSWLIFSATLGWITARTVFGPGPVNYHKILGAILFYLLMGLGFMSAYLLTSLLIPNAFVGLAATEDRFVAANFIYFSLVTLSTTGYGDIVPVHPIARSLSNVESLIGQLYPATLLARLVSLEISSKN